MTRTALIVGAGIGGLATAIALRRAGWDVRVFERASSPRAIGFGLGLAPNAIAALRDLGVADAMLARGYMPRRLEVRHPDGTILRRAELQHNALGGPMILALREALHGTLLEALDDRGIVFSTTVTGFSQRPSSVTLHTSSGDVQGDVLVGADGIGSIIRHALHPTERPPRPSGIVALRGVVHGASHYLGTLDGVGYFGRGIESMLLRASDTGIYWFLSLARELVSDGMSDPERLRAQMSASFDTTFNNITGAPGELRSDELVDRDPLPFWSQGRVTLAGDAAHPLLPHTGQGAAQAIIDGVTLGRVLAGDGEIASGLRTYEAGRRATVSRLLVRGRRIARVMRSRNRITCALRDNFVRIMPIETVAKLYATANAKGVGDIDP